MKKVNLVSVIVAVYKDINSLDLILKSLNNQTYKHTYEVIVAEDGEDADVANFINSLPYKNLLHTTQKDEGWRKNKSLNNAIRHSKGDLLIFLDGDCIPYSDLIENYVSQAREKTVLCGRRVELGENYTKMLRNKTLSSYDLEKSYLRRVFSLMKDKTRHYEEGLRLNDFLFNLKFKDKNSHILGCNFALNREDIYTINGFDEEYVWPSVGEDTDIEYRLSLIGCKMKPTRNKTNIFHLYHANTYSSENNRYAIEYFKTVQNTNFIQCKNGLAKQN